MQYYSREMFMYPTYIIDDCKVFNWSSKRSKGYGRSKSLSYLGVPGVEGLRWSAYQCLSLFESSKLQEGFFSELVLNKMVLKNNKLLENTKTLRDLFSNLAQISTQSKATYPQPRKHIALATSIQETTCNERSM